MNRTTVIVVAVLLGLMSVSAFGERPEKVEGAYYVGFQNTPGPSDRAMLRGMGAALKGEIPEANAIEIALRNPAAAEAISRNPRVLYVEEVPMRYKMDLATTQLTPSLTNGLYGLVKTGATAVHSSSTGTGIVVGVADTQLDVNHPDIKDNLITHTNCVSTNPCTGNGWQNDGETHATHVAGTILGVNNIVGVYGVAYGAKLVHARVLGPNGGSTSDIMRGVTWLTDSPRNAKIVNLSLGGGLKSRTEESFYNSIRKNKGVIVVAATGNDGRTTISYPAGYAVNVAVGAVDKNDALASFSNTGKGIDVVAPGVLVLSSVPAGTGHEASVTNGSTDYTAFGMEFAGNTNGVAGKLVDCGIGNPGDCGTQAAGFVALIQRGTLSFADKSTNAKNALAAAAIIYNNVAGDYTGTLGAAGAWIPTVSVSDTAGAALKMQLETNATVVNKSSSWDHYDGTSMATPHTAGVVALIWATNTAQTAATVESRLKNACKDLGAAGYDTKFGYGRVDAQKAILGSQTP